MRKIYKGLLLLTVLMSATGLAVGISYAKYNAPSETASYQFGSMDASDYNFQSLGYYFASGAGTEGSPYLINNSQQLRNLAKLQNSGALPAATYVSLGTSFQYEGTALEPIGNSTYPFTGVFNGNDHVITGLTVSTTATNVGMFGVLGTNTATGTVHNLVLAGPSISYTGSSNINIGIAVGNKNTTEGHISVVENVAVYGGTANFSRVRATVAISGGTPTCGNGIVGVGGSTTSGFISTFAGTPAYASALTYASITTSGTYSMYNNGSSMVVTKS